MKVILFLFALSFVCNAEPMPSLLDKKSLLNRFFSPQINDFFQTTTDLRRSDNDFNRNDEDPNFNYVPIMELDYYGAWNSTDESTTTQPFNFFDFKTGKAKFTASDKDKIHIDNYLYFWFYDGKYVDQKVAVFTFKYDNDIDFDPANSTFKNPHINFTLIMGENMKKTGEKSCIGSYQLSFTDSKDNNTPYNKTKNHFLYAVAEFWLESEECGIKVHSRVAVSNPERESKALYYSLLVTFMCLGHLYATIQIIKVVSQNDYDGARYSLITLCVMTIWDVFMCLFHLYNALSSEDFFHYFITPSFWFFILSSIFETRMILIVWKTKYYNQFTNVNEVRRGITSFYLKFYGGMIALLYFGYQFLPSLWFLYFTGLFFVPQIVHNCLRGQRYKFDPIYCFLLGALRIIIPVYVKGCPESLFELTPSYSFTEFYTALIFLQILILYLQARFGSRFFIPKCFLPPMFNYYVKVDPTEDTEDGEPELCAICMENLTEVVATSSSALIPKAKQVKLMVTPCRHKFHPHCLQQWMDLKLECPFCRAPIPPFE